jgi:hypothetical protein
VNSEQAFGIVAMFYAVANLGSMGLELDLRETIKSLRSLRVLALTLGWCWVVGPAFAVLLTKILPMAEPYAVGLIIFSLAPTTPMLLILIRKARRHFPRSAIMPLPWSHRDLDAANGTAPDSGLTLELGHRSCPLTGCPGDRCRHQALRAGGNTIFPR